MLKKNSYLVSVGIFLLFGFILYKYGIFQKLPEILRKLNLTYLILSLTFYGLTYYFRALRFHLIFPSVKATEMMAVMGIHTFLNNVLPFRSGEVSFPVILKRLFQVEVHASSTALLFIRFLDLLSLSFIFTISVFLVAFKEKKLIWFSLGIIVLLLLLFYLTSKVLKALRLRFSLVASILTFASAFLSFSKVSRLILYSFTTWMLKFLSFYFILKGGGIGLNFPQTVFVSTFGELTTILPIHSFGGFGTYEAGMWGGFKLLGVETPYALTVAFYFHLTLLLMSGVLALIGWLYLEKRYERY